jgi:hypothetical protein
VNRAAKATITVKREAKKIGAKEDEDDRVDTSSKKDAPAFDLSRPGSAIDRKTAPMIAERRG